MKADVKFKFLRFFKKITNSENSKQVNLLAISTIIIAIIGILPAIALPSYLSQVNIKAAQAEARQTLLAMNAAQQAYYLRNNQFLTNMADFQKFSGVSMKTATLNYTYDVVSTGGKWWVVNLAKPRLLGRSQLSGYAGGVGLINPPGTTKYTTVTVLCESWPPGVTSLPTIGSIKFSSTDIGCAGSFQLVK